MSTYKEHKTKAKEFLKALDGFFPNYEKIYDEFSILEVNPEDKDNDGYATVIFDAGNTTSFISATHVNVIFHYYDDDLGEYEEEISDNIRDAQNVHRFANFF